VTTATPAQTSPPRINSGIPTSSSRTTTTNPAPSARGRQRHRNQDDLEEQLDQTQDQDHSPDHQTRDQQHAQQAENFEHLEIPLMLDTTQEAGVWFANRRRSSKKIHQSFWESGFLHLTEYAEHRQSITR